MDISPFTKEKAKELALQFRHLENKQYIDEDILFTIAVVTYAPFGTHHNNEISDLFGKSIRLQDESKAFDILDYTNKYEGEAFDVVVLSASIDEHTCYGVAVTPLTLSADGEGFKYVFAFPII